MDRTTRITGTTGGGGESPTQHTRRYHSAETTGSTGGMGDHTMGGDWVGGRGSNPGSFMGFIRVIEDI